MVALPQIDMKVRLDNDSLVFQVQLPRMFDKSLASEVSLVVFNHDEVDSYWYLGLPVIENGLGIWVGKVNNYSQMPPAHLLELSAISVTQAQQPMALRPPLRGGSDFEKCYAFVEGVPVGATDPIAELGRIGVVREGVIGTQLTAEGGGASQFRAFVIADGCYFTRRLWVPGAALIPLASSTRGSDVGQILNSVLPQLGAVTGIDQNGWTQQYARSRPVVVCHLPNIIATDKDAALEVARNTARALLDIASLHRGAAAELICCIVETRNSAGAWEPAGVTNEHGAYGGNLLGGTISGEDETSLLASWKSIENEQRIPFWLSLYSDAKREKRWDFRWFRLFSLMETIAKERYGDGAPVVDFNGNHLLDDRGANVTTKIARGKVYKIFRDLSSGWLAQGNFCTDPSIDLWNEVRIWTDVRNAVAHEGGFREDIAAQQTSAPEVRVTAAFAAALGRQPLEPGRLQYLRQIDEAVKLLLSALVHGRQF